MVGMCVLLRGGVLAVLALVLAACETTGDIGYDGRPPAPNAGGFQPIVPGGWTNASALSGDWTLRDEFSRSCSLNLGRSPLGTANGALGARPSGFCSPEYSAVAGWMGVGQAIMLTNASGGVIGQLNPDGSSGNYSGSFNGSFGSSPVTMRRGFF